MVSTAAVVCVSEQCLCVWLCDLLQTFVRVAEIQLLRRAPDSVHVIWLWLTVLVCVCLLCPLLVTGMGNQWVQLFSISIRQGVNAACHILWRCGYYEFPFPKPLQSCCFWGFSSTSRRPRWLVFDFYLHVFLQDLPYFLLCVSNLNLILQFLALFCLKNRNLCSLPNMFNVCNALMAWNVLLNLRLMPYEEEI